MNTGTAWAPASVLIVGALLATVGVKAQRDLPLRVPLASAVPTRISGLAGHDLAVPDAELKVAGVSNYLYRDYAIEDTAVAGFSVYVGYYERQTQGKTVHSPKNCLPGAGWEPLQSQSQVVPTANGPVTVNRYLLRNGAQQAVVLYWYQGRGRVAWNEYGVKWDMLRDAALRHRSDEALVRIVVPVHESVEAAVKTAMNAASVLVPSVKQALPA